MVSCAVERTGLRKLAVAGGTFANVRLNQIILDMDCVDEIFIHPHMGDGGVTVGSALDVSARHLSLQPVAIDHVYWGNGTNEAEILESLTRTIHETASISRRDLFSQ